MITASEIKTKVDKEEKRLEDLHTRMDDDFKRWDVKEVVFDSHKNAINVTVNDPRTFSDDVQGTMSRAAMQIIVRMAERDEYKPDELNKLERLFIFLLEKADELLAKKLMPPLRDATIWHGLIRGCRAGRFLVYGDGNDVIPDFLPWDPRWVTYKVGKNGLIWAAYKMFREKDVILNEYGVEPSFSLTDRLKKVIPRVNPKDNFEVIDYWAIPDRNKPTEILNAVVNGDDFLKEPEILNLTSMPISIRPVAVRPQIISDDNLIATGHGDSIYAPNRATYELLNRLYSIEATRGNLLSKQPVINYFKQGGQTGLRDTVLQAEMVIDVPEETNKLEPMPMKEIPMTLLDMIDKLNSKRERAEVPHIEIGKPPPSGTLFSLVQEAGAKVYVPQLKNLSLFYADICRFMEEQLKVGGARRDIKKVDFETEVERKYQKVKVKPVDLKQPHIIKVEFTDRTPWTELEAYQIADMAKRQGLPDEFIWEYILKLTDPKGLVDQAAIELFEHSPTGMRLKAIKRLRELGRDDEARDLIEQLYQEEMDRTQAQQQTPASPMEVTTA